MQKLGKKLSGSFLASHGHHPVHDYSKLLIAREQQQKPFIAYLAFTKIVKSLPGLSNTLDTKDQTEMKFWSL